jgi:hypothetical protein
VRACYLFAQCTEFVQLLDCRRCVVTHLAHACFGKNCLGFTAPTASFILLDAFDEGLWRTMRFSCFVCAPDAIVESGPLIIFDCIRLNVVLWTRFIFNWRFGAPRIGSGSLPSIALS